MMNAAEVKPRSHFSRRWTWNRRAPLRGFYNAWLRFFQRALMDYHISGLEHVPPHGGAIVAINHINFWDPLVVMPSLGRDVIPLTKVEAWESPLRIFVEYYGAIPVHRGAVDTAAIRAATEALNEGYLVLISPEGTRSPTGALQRAQEGMAYLATRTGAPILPVAIQGTPDIIPALKRLQRARVQVTIGEPFTLDTGGNKPDRAMLEQLTDYAMRRLAALLPPHMRGVYA
ncbi:MAG: lysophospholipid acyltransferase family protein [Anaerolineae bacterium]|nr:1-acyl-sn-glycerol-3-phosphate acyltransferase [Thermoflexales bacterium]MCX7938794.1 1-acyl-sn-glycerol-3-phosphate acyltransferase [Thermoflexales bacterium]MDW8053471.1 lysophospholipid acyltransferase family protein [Anaerolineae bacterium]MDW8293211.1 lysophospholipid acyltransferase family protein [Anaerolineae bacterium]